MAGSTTVLAIILLVDVVAFGLAIGVEQSRPMARLEKDARKEWTYCVYCLDAATGLGGAVLALLLVARRWPSSPAASSVVAPRSAPTAPAPAPASSSSPPVPPLDPLTLVTPTSV